MHSVKLSHVVASMKHWPVWKGHTFFYPVIRNFIWIRLFRIISIPSKTVFSSVKPCDFDGMLGTGLPVSMYTTKTPLDKCRFNVAQLKELLTFSVKDRYQLNYFICINDFNAQTITSLKLNLFYFLIYCCQNLERKITCLGFFSVIRQTVRYWSPVLLGRFLDIFILQLLIIYRIYDYDILTLSQ
jgi:hypothetical protein